MTNPKISIILPIYNVEKYLEKCLDSVLTNQDLTEIEVICVDDSTPDNCPKIIAQYCQKDNRIKSIRKKNEGQGIARNEGLKLATGEYVLFLDPDDWIEPNSLKKCYEKIKNDDADVLFFNVICHNEKTNYKNQWNVIEPYYIKFQEQTFKPEQAQDSIYKTVSNPFRMYKRESLIKYNYYYTKNRHWEDHLPYFCFLANCEKISVLNDYVYNYLIRPSSSTYSGSKKYYSEIFDNYYECETALKQTRLGTEFMPYFIEHKTVSFLFYLNMMPFTIGILFYKKLKNLYKEIFKTYGNDVLKFNKHLNQEIELILKKTYISYLLTKNIRKIKSVIQMHSL